MSFLLKKRVLKDTLDDLMTVDVHKLGQIKHEDSTYFERKCRVQSYSNKKLGVFSKKRTEKKKKNTFCHG